MKFCTEGGADKKLDSLRAPKGAKKNVLHRCFELGESVKSVSEDIGYTKSSIFSWRKKYFPEKPSGTAEVEEEIKYTKDLVDALENRLESRAAQKLWDRVSEMLASDKIKNIQSEYDSGARVGHKTADTSFFGYKNHIAMNEERLITAIEVTAGQESDTKQFRSLVEKSEKNGIEIDEVIGDRAYSSKGNIDYCEGRSIKLIPRLNAVATNGQPQNIEFIYNKDAGTLQCPEGHLAMSHEIRPHKNGSQYYTYWFSVKKCRKCPRYGTCCKTGAKRKSCSVTVSGDAHRKQSEFEQADCFKTRIKERYKIEAKNAELKQVHGLDKCRHVGLSGMRMQMYFSAFASNVKRIIKLNEMATA